MYLYIYIYIMSSVLTVLMINIANIIYVIFPIVSDTTLLVYYILYTFSYLIQCFFFESWTANNPVEFMVEKYFVNLYYVLHLLLFIVKIHFYFLEPDNKI